MSIVYQLLHPNVSRSFALKKFGKRVKKNFHLHNFVDVNVMMFALQMKDMQAVWFDKRKSLNSIRPSAALGFILNVPSSSRMTNWLPSAIVSLKHWIAIRKIGTDELYFNLDSHLPEPYYIGNVRIRFKYLINLFVLELERLLFRIEKEKLIVPKKGHVG